MPDKGFVGVENVPIFNIHKILKLGSAKTAEGRYPPWASLTPWCPLLLPCFSCRDSCLEPSPWIPGVMRLVNRDPLKELWCFE